jgi:hypothetical protein
MAGAAVAAALLLLLLLLLPLLRSGRFTATSHGEHSATVWFQSLCSSSLWKRPEQHRIMLMTSWHVSVCTTSSSSLTVVHCS